MQSIVSLGGSARIWRHVLASSDGRFILAVSSPRPGRYTSVMPDLDLPEITANAEFDDFADLDFRLSSHVLLSDGRFSVDARGLHQGELVGFRAVIGKDWLPRLVAGTNVTLYWGHVELLSVATASDALVRVLDELYGVRGGADAMRERVNCAAVALSGDPPSVATQRTNMKLFMNSDDPDGAAELYLNVDVASGRIELHEKDPDYRVNVIRALRRETD